MKVSIDWLKDYIDIDMSSSELAEKLNLSGTAVDSIKRVGADFEGVVVGQILKIEPHPNADKLVLATVDAGGGELSIVCGAKNMKEGDKVALAKVGAVLKGEKLKKAKIRGVESQGMMCSAVELGLREEADGIMILDAEAKIGSDLKATLEMADDILELEITPNRPDCLSMLGIAREVSALTSNPAKRPALSIKEGAKKAKDKAKVEIEDADLCPRYVARIIEGIKIGPSPDWMAKRLKAAGIRPISNVVDVTNYVMLEMGQPLHAFDLGKITGGHIIVRRAKKNEKMTTLDGAERELDPSMLLITDPSGPVALAGVMGGAESEVSNETTTILLESAHFNAANISRTSRRLGLISESSLRFERGSDPNGADEACDRAAALIQMLAGGDILEGRLDAYPKRISPLKLSLRVERVNDILGTDISADQMKEILTSLDIEVEEENGAVLKVLAPTFRPDLIREIDLIEEIARIYGYNRIESTLPKGETVGGLSFEQRLKAKMKSSLISSGLFETVSYSFVAPDYLKKAALSEDEDCMGTLKLKNPLNEDQAVLRATLIPSILSTVEWNLNRSIDEVKIFEMARVYREEAGAELPVEKVMLSGALAGFAILSEWHTKERPVGFFDIKGVIEKLLSDLGITEYAFKPINHPSLHPLRSCELEVKGERAGILGEIHPEVALNYGFIAPIALFELSVDALTGGARQEKGFIEVGRFPGIRIDISMTIADEVSHKEIVETIKKSGGKLLKEVKLFDLYRSKEIGPGLKSMAYSLFLQSGERTLTDEEASKTREVVVEKLKEALSAKIRES